MKKLLQRWLGITGLQHETAALISFMAVPPAEKVVGTEIVDKGITGTPLSSNEIAVVKGYDRH